MNDVDDAIANEHHDGAISDEQQERLSPGVDDVVHEHDAGQMLTPAERDRTATEIVPMVTHEGAALIKATLNPDLSDAELMLFAAVANRVGLDPFARQIYAVKRNDNHSASGKRMTIQTGIDGFRLIARRTGKYGGRIGPYFCGDDGDWRVQRMPDGSEAPAPWLDASPPTAALVGVYRVGDVVPTYGIAKWSEYAVTGRGGEMWAKMPTTMLGKCAEAQAIRACFPAETSGLYTDDEMMQAEALNVTSTLTPLGGDVANMRPSDVHKALTERGLDASGKIDDMRERLAAALATERPAEQPVEAPAVEPVEGVLDVESAEHAPVASEPATDDVGLAGETSEGVSERPIDWNDDVKLMALVVNEVKGMQLSDVMRALAGRDLPESGKPDDKRRALAYALYLERGGTPAKQPTAPPYSGPQSEPVDPSTLPLDGSRDDDEPTS